MATSTMSRPKVASSRTANAGRRAFAPVAVFDALLSRKTVAVPGTKAVKAAQV